MLLINGKPVPEIIEALKSISSSDGFIDAFRLKSVENGFSKKYALYFGYPERFHVTYIAPGKADPEQAELLPVPIGTVNLNTQKGRELSFRIIDSRNTALLTINTFAYYDKRDMWRSFIDSAFTEIRENGIKNLIMDLRGNDGGDPLCSSFLLSYLAHEPVRYFVKPYGRHTELAEPLPLAENRFQGKLYTLIDGAGFSTTGHFCALLKYHGIGTFIGSETGATYTCTGSVHYVDLENTKLILGTAQHRRYSVVVKNMDRCRGILPDYHVEQTQQDLVAGKDTVLDFTIRLIGEVK
jgi:C-terminal processing protease CtpA/Prc